MGRPMPTDNPFLAGNGAPINLEADAADLVVVGEIPASLEGSYYRNGSNPQFAPRGGYHIFDGDGMIHAFHFRDGRVSYRSRWVQTERFLLEREAGEALFGSMADPASTHPSVVGRSSNAANTNVIWHADRLLALWEAGLPTELDPHTLETRGLFDYGGRLRRRVQADIARQVGIEAVEGDGPGILTAHPKIDPVSGEMIAFGYSPAPPHLVFYVISAAGELLRSEEIPVPYPSMMHDFIVTQEHVIFPIFPAVFDYEAMAKGSGILTWKPELGSRVGVMPRSGGAADLRWFESDPCYAFHFANAHTDGDRIHAQLTRFPKLPMFGEEGLLPPSFWRWTIDLAGGSLKEEPIDTVPAEFPRIDDRFAMRRNRYSFIPCIGPQPGGAFGFNALARYDNESGEKRCHPTRPGTSLGEPVFVPRHPGAPEGDGYLLVLAYRDDEKRSDLLIVDASDIEADPVATVQVPIRVPSGFHGNWRADPA